MSKSREPHGLHELTFGEMVRLRWLQYSNWQQLQKRVNK